MNNSPSITSSSPGHISSVTNSPTSQVNMMRPYPSSEDLVKCGIHLENEQSRLMELHQMLNSSQDINSVYDVVLSDNFYNKVNDLFKSVDTYDFSNLKCLMDNNPDKNAEKQMCDHLMTSNSHLNNIVRLADVIDKYEVILKKSLAKIYKLILDAQRHCNVNSENFIKLRKLASKISLLLADDEVLNDTCINKYKFRNIGGETLVKSCNDDDNSSYFITGCIVVLLICVLYMFSIRNVQMTS